MNICFIGRTALSKVLVISIIFGFYSCTKSKNIRYSVIENNVILQKGDDKIRISFISDDLVRFSQTKGDKFIDTYPWIKDPCGFNAPNISLSENNGSLLIKTEKLLVAIDLASLKIKYSTALGEMIVSDSVRYIADTIINNEKTQKVGVNFQINNGGALYGLGQFPDDFLNLRNKEVDLHQENTRIAVPFLLSTYGFGIVWNNASHSYYKGLGGEVSFSSESAEQIDYCLMYGPDFDHIHQLYSKLTGEAPLFGKWAYGYWQSKNRYENEKELFRVIKKYRELKIPFDNIVVDYFYWGKNGCGSFIFDSSYTTSPKKMIDSIHQLNGHVMITVWPSFKKGIKNYTLMKGNNYLLGFNDYCGEIYDAFNPMARKSYWELLNSNLFRYGIDAWWMDASEPENYKGLHESTTSIGPAFKVQNLFPFYTTKGVYENQRQVDSNKRVFILTRSAFLGQQKNSAAVWSGDIGYSMEVLRKQIPAGLNFCATGIPYWTTDIGGYSGGDPEDPLYRETFVRWFQFGTFCPIFRVHGVRPGNEVWSFGQENQKILTNFVNLRYRLLPYIYSIAHATTNSGYVQMRLLAFDFRNDTSVYNIQDQYMFGPSFMVCPVTDHQYVIEKPDTSKSNMLFQYSIEGKPGIKKEIFSDGTFTEKVNQEFTSDFLIHKFSSPGPGIPEDGFSVRWTTELEVKQNSAICFNQIGDDGFRFILDKDTLVNQWEKTDEIRSKQICKNLIAGKKYSITVEYIDYSSGAFMFFACEPARSLKKSGYTLNPKTGNREIYLPAGTKWYNFWTGSATQGGTKIIEDTPMDRIPLFIKAGSILPMGPLMQYANEKLADPLEIRIYPGNDGTFTLYEDDGETYQYENGEYSSIQFTWNDVKKELIISEPEGKYYDMKIQKTFKIIEVKNGLGIGVKECLSPDKIIQYSGARTIVTMN